MAIADDLTAILEIKQNIKTALQNKGLTPTDNFFTYADLINNISAGLTIGEQKTCNISYNFQSTVMGLPIILPSLEPTTAQVSYTVQTGYFPTLSGDLPASVQYGGGIFAGGQNNNAGSLTLSWRVKRNGTNIANGTQIVTAGSKWCLNSYSLLGTNMPVVGDIIEVYLWCTTNGTDMVLNRYGLSIIPMDFKPLNNPEKLLMFTSFSAVLNVVPAGFNASLSSYSGTLWKYFYNCSQTFNSGTYSFKGDFEDAVKGVWSYSVYGGSYNTVRIHSSNYNVEPFSVVNSSSWCETNIRY